MKVRWGSGLGAALLVMGLGVGVVSPAYAADEYIYRAGGSFEYGDPVVPGEGGYATTYWVPPYPEGYEHWGVWTWTFTAPEGTTITDNQVFQQNAGEAVSTKPDVNMGHVCSVSSDAKTVTCRTSRGVYGYNSLELRFWVPVTVDASVARAPEDALLCSMARMTYAAQPDPYYPPFDPAELASSQMCVRVVPSLDSPVIDPVVGGVAASVAAVVLAGWFWLRRRQAA